MYSLDGGEELQVITRSELGHGGYDEIRGVQCCDDGQLVLVTVDISAHLTLHNYQVSL